MTRISKSPKKETFIIVMPAYNEAKQIENTINSWIPIVNFHPGSEILVINDGSTDKTKDILKKLTKKYKFLKAIHKKNEGHGKTILLGFTMAIQTNHDWVFQTDSDGHFYPKDFYKLWEKRNSSDFILGHRHKRKDSLDRLLLTKIISLWILILFGKYIKDPNVPFRLIRRNYLKEVLKMVPDGVFAPNIFLSIIAAKQGHNLHHIRIKHRLINNNHNKMRLFKGALTGFIELTLFAF